MYIIQLISYKSGLTALKQDKFDITGRAFYHKTVFLHQSTPLWQVERKECKHRTDICDTKILCLPHSIEVTSVKYKGPSRWCAHIDQPPQPLPLLYTFMARKQRTSTDLQILLI